MAAILYSTRRDAFVCLLGASLAIVLKASLIADETGTKYVAIAIPFAALGTTHVIGTFDDSDDAYNAGMNWINTHDGDMFKVERITGRGAAQAPSMQSKGDAVDFKQMISNIKHALDDAQRFIEGKTPSELRDVGDTLKEYGDQIASTWKQVFELRNTLTTEAQGLTNDILREANKVIADFNSSASNYNHYSKQAGHDPIATVAPVGATIPSFHSGQWIDIGPMSLSPREELTRSIKANTRRIQKNLRDFQSLQQSQDEVGRALDENQTRIDELNRQVSEFDKYRASRYPKKGNVFIIPQSDFPAMNAWDQRIEQLRKQVQEHTNSNQRRMDENARRLSILTARKEETERIAAELDRRTADLDTLDEGIKNPRQQALER